MSKCFLANIFRQKTIKFGQKSKLAQKSKSGQNRNELKNKNLVKSEISTKI